MREKRLLFACALLTGIALPLVFQPATTLGATDSMQTTLAECRAEEAENAQLKARLQALEAAGEAYTSAVSQGDRQLTETLALGEGYALFANRTELVGPGVEIVLNDAKSESFTPGSPVQLHIVHDNDVLSVVNELRAAGAEAISINDVRLIATSRIRCGGPTIHIRDTPLAPPFFIRAIGDPVRLERQLLEGGDEGEMSLYTELTMYGVQFSVKQRESVTIKRYYGSSPLRLAKEAL